MSSRLGGNPARLSWRRPIVDEEKVAYTVKKGLEAQFETYSWEDMIDDLGLTRDEAAWAKEHTTYAVKVI